VIRLPICNVPFKSGSGVDPRGVFGVLVASVVVVVLHKFASQRYFQGCSDDTCSHIVVIVFIVCSF